MSATRVHQLRWLSVVGIAVFILFVLLQTESVTGASLVVWTDNGQQHIHDLFIVEQINFTSDQLRVTTEYSTNQYPLESIDRIDFLDYPTDVEDKKKVADIIKAAHLFQNYPNPFNPETRIRFELPARGRAQLRIYSVKGQVIRTLIEKDMAAGPHSIRWDGRDDLGQSVASGVYFYSLSTPSVKESRKMILLR
jgi:hypothetical protein